VDPRAAFTPRRWHFRKVPLADNGGGPKTANNAYLHQCGRDAQPFLRRQCPDPPSFPARQGRRGGGFYLVGAALAIFAGGLDQERQQLIGQGVPADAAESCSARYTFRSLASTAGVFWPSYSKARSWTHCLPSAGSPCAPNCHQVR
jgi:hypothetical protein